MYHWDGESAWLGWHCAQLVGWNDGGGWWLFKSSWGTEVADKGFFKVLLRALFYNNLIQYNTPKMSAESRSRGNFSLSQTALAVAGYPLAEDSKPSIGSVELWGMGARCEMGGVAHA